MGLWDAGRDARGRNVTWHRFVRLWWRVACGNRRVRCLADIEDLRCELKKSTQCVHATRPSLQRHAAAMEWLLVAMGCVELLSEFALRFLALLPLHGVAISLHVVHLRIPLHVRGREYVNQLRRQL